MSQVNVNTPGEPTGSGGAGMIVGVVLAIVVIGALVYFLLLNNGGNGGNGGDPADNGNGGNSGGDAVESVVPEPSAWMLVYLA